MTKIFTIFHVLKNRALTLLKAKQQAKSQQALFEQDSIQKFFKFALTVHSPHCLGLPLL